MKVHKVTLYIIDHDEVGADGVECGNCRARKSFPSQGHWTSYEKWSNAGPRFED